MVILDTSATIEMISDTALGRGFFELIVDDEEVITCDFYKLEAANVLRRIMRSEKCSRDRAYSLYEDAIRLIDHFVSAKDLLPEALNESFRLDHPIYDMLFFVLARRTQGTLFTADTRLQNLCLNNGVECVTLVDL